MSEAVILHNMNFVAMAAFRMVLTRKRDHLSNLNLDNLVLSFSLNNLRTLRTASVNGYDIGSGTVNDIFDTSFIQKVSDPLPELLRNSVSW